MNLEIFLNQWGESARTSLGFFWMAFWAFGLGYLISSLIQLYVSEEKMHKLMGKNQVKAVGISTFFGFISSSCSFAALSTSRALFAKGASLISSLAFLLASTNLVVELGIVISLFLSWQFVVGEYIGGILLIFFMAIVVKFTAPSDLIRKTREKLKAENSEDVNKTVTLNMILKKYIMEWKMVWKDVLIGFTIAGVIASFVPKSFFATLFVGIENGNNLGFVEILLHTITGPIAAFFTFIGSMGNIPLAAVLFSNGVSFAGVMAFIFSDLVVFPLLRIQAKYYGWKMAIYILIVFLIVLVMSSVTLHYGFEFFNILPEPGTNGDIVDREFFKIDYSFYLNLLFSFITAYGLYIYLKDKKKMRTDNNWSEILMQSICFLCGLWLIGGFTVHLL